MCGRGIDQVLAHPCSAEIYEDYMRSAEGYVRLAEQVNGPIPRRNGSSYVWGRCTGPTAANAAGCADHQS
jgi:poly-gamma-glutamate capsule biosynthesis protein CapA/YwtB (metallophosphatase superfamily)